MVLLELAGVLVSSTKVIFQSIAKAFTNAVAANAPNGTPFQKIAGGVFGYEFTTQMTPTEARLVLGFEGNQELTLSQIKKKMNTMLRLNDVSKGGSPYLNERFIVAAHVLSNMSSDNL